MAKKIINWTQNIHCDTCGKFLFTEESSNEGITRTRDKNDYMYDEIKAIFTCNECLQREDNQRVEAKKIIEK